MVEGVHFLEDDPPDLIGRKLLRVNLSDLAAKGAVPYGYFLAVAWPAAADWGLRGAVRAGPAEGPGGVRGEAPWAATPSATPGP